MQGIGDWLSHASEWLSDGTTLLERITGFLVALGTVGSAYAALRGRKSKVPHRSTTTIAPAANETAQEELAREVGYADIVTAEARQRRQAAWNGIAGNWLLPIAVAAGVVYLMAPALSLLVRPADHPTQAILSGAVGVLIGICWLIQRVFTPSWRSKQATKRATGLAGVRQELDEAMAVRLQTPRQAATIAQIEAIAERGIDKARAAETKDRDVGR